MFNLKNKKLPSIISYLIWAFTIARWTPVDMTQDWLENLWVIIPLAIYGLLIGLETWLTRNQQWRLLFFLSLQASLVFVVSLQSRNLDYFNLLLMIPMGNAILQLQRRPAYILVGVVTGMMIISLAIMQGWPNAISLISLYGAAIIFTVGYSTQISESNEARQKSQRLLIEVQEYSKQARQLAIVEERNRLARELHDSVTQSLYGLTLQAEAVARELEITQDNQASEEVREMGDIAQQALKEMRLMIFELRPTILEEEGLAAALHARLEAVENRSGLRTSLDIAINQRLALELENGLYGIAREALNNIAKHAQAQLIEIRLSPGSENTILFEILDDGVGFDLKNQDAHGGMGLKGMKERAENMGANLTVTSQPAEGTRIPVEVQQ